MYWLKTQAKNNHLQILKVKHNTTMAFTEKSMAG